MLMFIEISNPKIYCLPKKEKSNYVILDFVLPLQIKKKEILSVELENI